MDCPVCQKVNTDTALTCDCGHKFAESTTTLDATRIEPAHRTTFFKLIMGLLGLGAVGMGWRGVQTGEPEFLVKASVLALGVVASWYGNWIGPLCIIGLYLYHGIVLAQEGKLGLAEIVGILVGILLVGIATRKVWKPSVTATVEDGPSRATPKNTSDWTWVLWVGALIGVVAGLGWCASSTTTPSRPAAAQVSTATEAPRPAYTAPAPEPRWVRVDLERYSFEILDVPKENKTELRLDWNRSLSSEVAGRGFFSASVVRYEQGGNVDATATLKDTRDHVMRQKVGTLLSDNPVKVAGRPGRAFSARHYNPDGVCAYLAWVATYPVEQYVLTHCTQGVSEQDRVQDRNRFFGSVSSSTPAKAP